MNIDAIHYKQEISKLQRDLTAREEQLNVATKLLDASKDESKLLALYLADIRKASNNEVIRDLCDLALEPYKAPNGDE